MDRGGAFRNAGGRLAVVLPTPATRGRHRRTLIGCGTVRAMAHERLRFPAPAPRKRRALPAALGEPLRAAILISALITILGSIQPFMHIWRPGTGWIDVTGFEQSGDGGYVLELAVVAAVLAWIDGAWNSRIVVLVAGPAVLGASSLVILRDFYQTGVGTLGGLANGGGYGGFEPGFWVTVLGAATLAATGALRAWRVRGRLSLRPGAALAGVAGMVGAIGGAAIGFVAGATITPLLVHVNTGPTSMVLVIVGSALAVLGAWIGAMVATGAVRSIRRS